MARSENGCGKLHFWSEIGSGFGEPGDTPPPRIARSIPLEMKPIFQVFSFFVFRQSLDDFSPHSRAPVKKIRKFDLKVWLVSLCMNQGDTVEPPQAATFPQWPLPYNGNGHQSVAPTAK